MISGQNDSQTISVPLSFCKDVRDKIYAHFNQCFIFHTHYVGEK